LLPSNIGSEDVPFVNFVYNSFSGKTVDVYWEPTSSTLKEGVKEIIENEELSKEDVALLTQTLKDAYAAEKAKHQRIYNEKKARLQTLETALSKFRIFKFYPSHPMVDVRPYVVRGVNRYLPDAYQVFAAHSTVESTTKEFRLPAYYGGSSFSTQIKVLFVEIISYSF
jgi:hypothetical protein